MPSWNDLGAAFNTLRELDVTAISEESERHLRVACLGARPLAAQVAGLLRDQAGHRYGAAGRDPLLLQPLPAGEPGADLTAADLLLIVIDGREPISAAGAASLARLGELGLPTVIAICGVASPGELGQPRPEFARARIVVLADLAAPEAAETLAAAMLELLPEDRRLAAARALPGLRLVYGRELVNGVSFTNATYAFASSIPEQIPVLAVPFAAADLIVLTKNQALMVYRLALAHGAAPEFQARIAELAPVIGGAFVWRQIARTLVSLIPIWGVVPKVAIAYAGTFTTGTAAVRWFADGELLSGDRLKQLSDQALSVGRERAQALVAAARKRSMDAGVRLGQRQAAKGKLGPGEKPTRKK